MERNQHISEKQTSSETCQQFQICLVEVTALYTWEYIIVADDGSSGTTESCHW